MFSNMVMLSHTGPDLRCIENIREKRDSNPFQTFSRGHKNTENKKKPRFGLLSAVEIILAGVEGFEPPNAWTKTMCLTTWRHPKAPLFYHKWWGCSSPASLLARSRRYLPGTILSFCGGCRRDESPVGRSCDRHRRDGCAVRSVRRYDFRVVARRVKSLV